METAAIAVGGQHESDQPLSHSSSSHAGVAPSERSTEAGAEPDRQPMTVQVLDTPQRSPKSQKTGRRKMRRLRAQYT
jgi:hypothetical protein